MPDKHSNCHHSEEWFCRLNKVLDTNLATVDKNLKIFLIKLFLTINHKIPMYSERCSSAPIVLSLDMNIKIINGQPVQKNKVNSSNQSKHKEYRVSLVIGNYPLGHRSGCYVFRAFKHPENSHALWNCIWIWFALHKSKIILIDLLVV